MRFVLLTGEKGSPSFEGDWFGVPGGGSGHPPPEHDCNSVLSRGGGVGGLGEG